MHRFAALLLVLFSAFAADAAEPLAYPNTLIDANCADTKDTLPFTEAFRSGYTETSGSANGLCDSDNRIIAPTTTAITASTYFGPITRQGSLLYLFSDGDTIGGTPGNWRICIYADRADDPGTKKALACGPQQTGAQDVVQPFGAPGTALNGSGLTTSTYVGLPPVYYVYLELLSGTTSWVGSLSLQHAN
jgi:hypothetical protein